MKKLKLITLFFSSLIICSSCLMMNIAGCRTSKKTYIASVLVNTVQVLIDNVQDGGRVYNIQESDLTTLTETKKGGELKLKNTKEAHVAFRKVLFGAVLSQNKKVTRDMLNLIYFNDFKSVIRTYHFFLHKGKLSYVTGSFRKTEIDIYLKILPSDSDQRKVNYYLFSQFNPRVSKHYLTIPFVSSESLPASDSRIAQEIRTALISYSIVRQDNIITDTVAQKITFNLISSKGHNNIATHDDRIYNIIAVFDNVEFCIKVKEKEDKQQPLIN